jgi:hypothetical protein
MTRKVPLEWPATRLENGWAPQGVAFEPSAFRQHECERSRLARTTNHAQILKRQRGLSVNQVPSGSAGSSPALCTTSVCVQPPHQPFARSVRSSMVEPCGATAQTWVRFPSAALCSIAWEANLAKALRSSRGDVGSKPTPGTDILHSWGQALPSRHRSVARGAGGSGPLG